MEKEAAHKLINNSSPQNEIFRDILFVFERIGFLWFFFSILVYVLVSNDHRSLLVFFPGCVLFTVTNALYTLRFNKLQILEDDQKGIDIVKRRVKGYPFQLERCNLGKELSAKLHEGQKGLFERINEWPKRVEKITIQLDSYDPSFSEFLFMIERVAVILLLLSRLILGELFPIYFLPPSCLLWMTSALYLSHFIKGLFWGEKEADSIERNKKAEPNDVINGIKVEEVMKIKYKEHERVVGELNQLTKCVENVQEVNKKENEKWGEERKELIDKLGRKGLVEMIKEWVKCLEKIKEWLDSYDLSEWLFVSERIAIISLLFSGLLAGPLLYAAFIPKALILWTTSVLHFSLFIKDLFWGEKNPDGIEKHEKMEPNDVTNGIKVEELIKIKYKEQERLVGELNKLTKCVEKVQEVHTKEKEKWEKERKELIDKLNAATASSELYRRLLHDVVN